MKSSAMAATKRSSPLPGWVLSSSSQLQSHSFHPAIANSTFMPRRPNIGTSFASWKIIHQLACCPTMTKQSDSPTSKWQDMQDLSGVVLSRFDHNDFMIKALRDILVVTRLAYCNVFPLVLSSFKDQHCFALLILPLSLSSGKTSKMHWFLAFAANFLVRPECHYPGLQDFTFSSSHTFLQS